MQAALELGARRGAAARCPSAPSSCSTARSSAKGSTSRSAAHDPTAHAEIVALRDAAKRVGNYRLPGATLYVTIEPCQMCVGAMVHARIARLVYGAREPKAGAIESADARARASIAESPADATGGVLEDECRELIQEFLRGDDRS